MTATRTNSKSRAKAASRSTSNAKSGTRSSGNGPRSGGDRFAGRRHAEERRQGRRKLLLILGLTVVCTLAIGVIGFMNSSWFDVNDIVVAGNNQADPHLIVDASAIEIGQALLEVDLDAAVRNVELVPWVGTATVNRSWTGSIEIVVTERGPSAVLDAGARYALVDDHGRQLEIVDSRPEGFMPVIGIETSGVAGEAAPDIALPVIALLDAIPAEVEQQITAVVVEEEQLYLELAVDGRANFGDGSDLGPKLQALETMLAAVDLTCLSVIDLRVPGAPALTRRPSATESGESVAGESADGAASGTETETTQLTCEN